MLCGALDHVWLINHHITTYANREAPRCVCSLLSHSSQAQYLPRHPILPVPVPVLVLQKETDPASHTYTTTGKIRKILRIILFIFLNGNQGNRRFCTEKYQAFPDFRLLLISSWTKFWFVRFVPTYLNFTTIFKDVLPVLICALLLHSF